MLQGETIWGFAVPKGLQGKYKQNVTEGIHTQKDVRDTVDGRLKKEAEERRKEQSASFQKVQFNAGTNCA